jgi:hypothetical protein
MRSAAWREGVSPTIAPAAALNYAGERADPRCSSRIGCGRCRHRQLDGVYRDLERPLIPVLAAMEQAESASTVRHCWLRRDT